MTKSKKSKLKSIDADSSPILSPAKQASKIRKSHPPSAHPSTDYPKSSRPSFNKNTEILLTENTKVSGLVYHIISLNKYDSALDLCGSFLLHFTLDETPQGIEAQDLLMDILEPLLGEKMKYKSFKSGMNNYLQRPMYREGKVPLTENMRRYIETVTFQWKGHSENR